MSVRPRSVSSSVAVLALVLLAAPVLPATAAPVPPPPGGRTVTAPAERVLAPASAGRAVTVSPSTAATREPTPVPPTPSTAGRTAGPPDVAAPSTAGRTARPPDVAAPSTAGPTSGPPDAPAPATAGPTAGPPDAAAPATVAPSALPTSAAAAVARDDAATVSVGGSITVDVLANDEGTDGTQLRVVSAARGLDVAVTAERALEVGVGPAALAGTGDVVYALTRAGRDVATATLSLEMIPPGTPPDPAQPSGDRAQPSGDPAQSSGDRTQPSGDPAQSSATDEPGPAERPTLPGPGPDESERPRGERGSGGTPADPGRPAPDPVSRSQDAPVLTVTPPVDLTGVLAPSTTAPSLVPQLTPSPWVPGLGVAVPDTVRTTTSVGRSVTVDVLPAGTGGVTVVAATQPGSGRVEVRPDHVVYTPAAGFSGEDDFDVTLSDGRTTSVVVSVLLDRSAPEAVDDVASTRAGEPVLVRVLSNDRHLGAGADVSVVTAARHGVAVVAQDGAVTYRPAPGFTGTDRFTYAVTTAAGVDRAQVEVVVRPRSAVLALDDEVLTSPGSPVQVDVRDNDIGADGLHVVVPDELPDVPGEVSVDGRGRVTYAPPDDRTTVSIPYALTLDEAGTQVLARAVLRVRVRPADELVAVDDVLVLEPGAVPPYEVDVTANDQGVERAVLSASCTAAETCAIRDGLVWLDVDIEAGQRVTFTYTLQIYSPNRDTIEFSDRAEVTVIAPPDGPLDQAVAVDDRARVLLGDSVHLDVLSNDTLPEGYQPEVVPDADGRASFAYDGQARRWRLAYTAPREMPASGVETITYRLSEVQIGITRSGLEVGTAPTAVVTVDLAGPDARDDAFVLEAVVLSLDEPLDVLANDDTPAGAVADPTSTFPGGEVRWNATSRSLVLRLVDRSPRTVTFTYDLVAPGGAVLDSARVTVRVRRAVAVPDQAVAVPGVPVDIPVLSNDRETEGRTVQVPRRSGSGTVTFDERRGVVVYTMDVGYTGATDGFTYRLGLPFQSFLLESTAAVTVTRATPPTAPTSLTAERRDDGVVVVRWEPPDSDGGTPITGYRVRDAEPSDEYPSVDVTVPATDRSVELSELGEDTGDSLTVVALNAAGEGPPARIAVPRRPSAPQDLSAVGGPSSIALEWRPPASAGSGPLTGYRVTWDRQGGTGGASPSPSPTGPVTGGSQLLPPTATRTRIRGVQDGVTYEVSVVALNDSGAGPAARASATPRSLTPVDDRALTTATAPVDIPVLANDPDVTGATLSVDVLPADRGRADVVGDVLRYTPSGPFGRVELTYRLSAPGVELGRGTAVVEEVDAVDDVALSPRGRPTAVDVLANDLVPFGVALQVVAGSDGTLGLDGSGVRFTPAPGFVGTAEAAYELVGDGRTLDRATVTVEVGVRPDAVDDTATAVAGEAEDIAVLSNDLGTSGLTVRLLEPSDDPGLLVLPSGVVRYTPPVDAAGPFTFRYGLAEGTEVHDVATVTVTVTPARPVAVDDEATTQAGTPVTVDVRANDLRAEGTTLVLSSAAGASVVGGAVRYTPPAGVVGVITLTYGLSRGGPVLSEAELRVTVQSPSTEEPTPPPSETPEPEPEPSATTTETPDPPETPAPPSPSDTDTPTPTPTTPPPSPTQTPPPSPGPELEPITLVPGERLRLSGDGCEPGEQVRLRIEDQPVGSTTADGSGRFTVEVTAPTPVGRYVVVAVCGDRELRQPIRRVATVIDGADGSAATGGAVVIAGLLAFYLLTGSVLAPRGTAVDALPTAEQDEG